MVYETGQEACLLHKKLAQIFTKPWTIFWSKTI